MTYSAGHLAAIAAGVVLLALLVFAFSASNTVPASHAGQSARSIGAQDIARTECAGMGLTTVVTNGAGSAGNDLVLGTAAARR
jgi:hypothetical protein